MKNFSKYFTITSAEERWGLYLTTTGFTRIEPAAAKTYPVNKEHPSSYSLTWKSGRVLKEFQLVYITAGNGVFESSQVPLRNIDGGTCFLLYPGTWHRYKPLETSGWTEYWIGFKGYYPEQLMRKGFFQEDKPVIDLGIDEEVLILFQKLFMAVDQAQPGYPQVMSAMLMEIFARIYTRTYYDVQHKGHDENLVVRAKFLMREAIEESNNIEDIIKDLPVSYSKFRKVFKQVTGESPNQYYLNLRLKKAMTLLDATHLSVNEIAYQTGFESVFYFSKLFKKKNGLSPSAWREQKKSD